MMKYVFFLIAILLTTNGFAQQEEKSPTASIKEVSKQMAEVWCLKLEECAQDNPMGPKECRKVLKQSFSRGFKNTAEGQKVAVTQDNLKQCSESIKQDSCEALKKAQTLPGCAFISLLNRY